MVNRRGITRNGCLFAIVVLAADAYVGIPIGKTYFRYLEYKDAIPQELRFRSGQPNERIMQNLKLAADSLGLPEEASKVTITRANGEITVEADYQEVVHFPRYDKVIRFQPRVTDTY